MGLFVFGSVREYGHSEFGNCMYAALPGLLANGLIKVVPFTSTSLLRYGSIDSTLLT